MSEYPLDPVADRVRDALDIARDALNPDEALDLVVRELSNASGGPYGFLAAAFRLLDEDEAGKSYGSSYGTVVQDALMLRAARLVIDNPNGCRDRFGMLLRALAEKKGLADYAAVVLARSDLDDPGLLVPVSPPAHYLDRSREIARRIVEGEGR